MSCPNEHHSRDAFTLGQTSGILRTKPVLLLTADFFDSILDQIKPRFSSSWDIMIRCHWGSFNPNFLMEFAQESPTKPKISSHFSQTLMIFSFLMIMVAEQEATAGKFSG